MYRAVILGLAVASLLALSPGILADETRVDVRVISKGAKFIGTSMGGAEILIEDAETGQLLARGKTAGTTGDTEKIMVRSAKHHAPVSTADAAVFRAKLKLDEPRKIKVTARGPLAQPQATGTVTATQWIVPGKHVTGGDALTLEMPGLVVDVLDPPAHRKFSQPVDVVPLKVNVTMMCGCPIEPDGLWDANRLEVKAIVKRDGKKISEVPFQYAGTTSQFAAKLKAPQPGTYEITVYAHEPDNGNTGVDMTTLIIADQ